MIIKSVVVKFKSYSWILVFGAEQKWTRDYNVSLSQTLSHATHAVIFFMSDISQHTINVLLTNCLISCPFDAHQKFSTASAACVVLRNECK